MRGVLVAWGLAGAVCAALFAFGMVGCLLPTETHVRYRDRVVHDTLAVHDTTHDTVYVDDDRHR